MPLYVELPPAPQLVEGSAALGDEVKRCRFGAALCLRSVPVLALFRTF
jgi:hypothetical protein